jgi:hypothetical protein
MPVICQGDVCNIRRTSEGESNYNLTTLQKHFVCIKSRYLCSINRTDNVAILFSDVNI